MSSEHRPLDAAVSPSPTARVEAAASALCLDVEVIARAPANSLDDAAALLGVTSRDIVKTLVVARHDGTYLFALVPGDRQISWPLLRAVVGVNRLRLPPPEDALAATGYERGTIVPLGSSTAWPVFADERVRGGRIVLGAGAHGYSIAVDADDLLSALRATVADITVPIARP